MCYNLHTAKRIRTMPMARNKFTLNISFHNVGDVFEVVGFGGTEKRSFEILKVEGALAEMIRVGPETHKRFKGRPLKVVMLEDFKEPEFFEVPF
jgi:hypothetical protein